MNMFCTDMYCQKAAKDSCVSGLMFVVSHVTIKGLLIFSTGILINVQIHFNQDFFSKVCITSFSLVSVFLYSGVQSIMSNICVHLKGFLLLLLTLDQCLQHFTWP